MTTDRLIAVDLAVSVAAAAAWLGAGASAAARRPRVALALLGIAILTSAARAMTVLLLAGAGWWFVQEKVILALPLLVVAGLAAVALAGPHLAVAARPGEAGGSADPSVVEPRMVTALLTAGYAAAAGPIVTLLSGYPTSWSIALIAVASVGAAAVLTGRVIGAISRGRTPAVTIFAVGLVGVGLAFAGSSDMDLGGGAAGGQGQHHAVPVTALRGPTTPGVGGSVRRFTLTARTATVRLTSGREVQAWTFDGQVPGPPIVASQGDLVEVSLRNTDITAGVTLHWHGYDVPAAEDGVPGLTQDAVMPGEQYVYRFRADQAGTFWYHTHEVSDRAVKLGLYGSLVVMPRNGEPGVDLTLPVHTLGGSVVIGDRDGMSEQAVAAGTRVRLRVINTDDVPQELALSGSPFRLVAVDGADLNDPAEVSRKRLRLPAGGRYDLTFTMPANPTVLLIGNDRTTGLTLRSAGAAVASQDSDTAGWPMLDLFSYGAPAPTPFDANTRFDRRFTLVLDRGLAFVDSRPAYAHTVNGRAFPAIPVQWVRDGDLVEMTVVNRGQATHPWHLHGHRVLVLTRDGHAPTGSPLWLDTFDVRPGEVWQVAFRAINPGLWMNHCHNLSHADQGMALHLAYEGVTSSIHGGAHGG
jgi:FtsP/CotA-like multicopper oxidase with cupredoxin domain